MEIEPFIFWFPQVCHFVNSGSEANDLALMMARAHTGNFDIVSLRFVAWNHHRSKPNGTLSRNYMYGVGHGMSKCLVENLKFEVLRCIWPSLRLLPCWSVQPSNHPPLTFFFSIHRPFGSSIFFCFSYPETLTTVVVLQLLECSITLRVNQTQSLQHSI